MVRARRGSETGTLAAFRTTVRVEVRRPEVVMHRALAHLDVERLARAARARVEIGYVDAGCCRQAIEAEVRRGRVTALHVEPCERGAREPLPADLRRLVTRAIRTARGAARRSARPRLPLPVPVFLEGAAQITVETITCVRICFLGWCFVCCTTTIPGTPVWCGDRIVIES